MMRYLISALYLVYYLSPFSHAFFIFCHLVADIGNLEEKCEVKFENSLERKGKVCVCLFAYIVTIHFSTQPGAAFCFSSYNASSLQLRLVISLYSLCYLVNLYYFHLQFPLSRPQSPYERNPTPGKARDTKNCKPLQTPATGKAGSHQVTKNISATTTNTLLQRKTTSENASPNIKI